MSRFASAVRIAGILLLVLATCLVGCKSSPPQLGLSEVGTDEGTPIPPADQFRVPAVGIPVQDTSKEPDVKLPPETGGVIFFNSMGNPIQIVISGTVASIPSGQGFLFILPPQRHKFYIYGMFDRPIVKTIQAEMGKFSYNYLVPMNSK